MLQVELTTSLTLSEHHLKGDPKNGNRGSGSSSGIATDLAGRCLLEVKQYYYGKVGLTNESLGRIDRFVHHYSQSSY